MGSCFNHQVNKNEDDVSDDNYDENVNQIGRSSNIKTKHNGTKKVKMTKIKNHEYSSSDDHYSLENENYIHPPYLQRPKFLFERLSNQII